MSSQARLRATMRVWFCIEVICAVSAAVGAVAALIVPDWIERLFDAAPDGGDGAFEAVLPLVLGLVAVVCAWSARREWQRSASALGSG